MTKNEFLGRLSAALGDLPQQERNDILNDYAEHFDIGMANGKSEEEIAARLGSPEELAATFRENPGARRQPPPNAGAGPGANPDFGRQFAEHDSVPLDGVHAVLLRGDAAEFIVTFAPVAELQVDVDTRYLLHQTDSKSYDIRRSGEELHITVARYTAARSLTGFLARIKVAVTIPAGYAGALSMYMNACNIKVSGQSALTMLSVYGSAVNVNASELCCATTVDLSASNGRFQFARLLGDVGACGKASNIDVYIPADSGAVVECRNLNLSSFRNDFGLGSSWGSMGDGSHRITFFGDVSRFTLRRA